MSQFISLKHINSYEQINFSSLKVFKVDTKQNLSHIVIHWINFGG